MKFEKEINLECSINLHKRVFGVKFKNRASRSIFELKNFAYKLLGTKNIRIDTDLNKLIWKYGARNVPFKIRIRMAK
jgi:large subunit ribosomal protein L31e